MPAPPPKVTLWPPAVNKSAPNLTADLPPLAGKLDAARAAALDARDAAVAAADAKLAAAGLPTVTAALGKHVNASASVRAAANAKSADAAAALRKKADAARRAADAATVNGTITFKSDVITDAAQKLDAAADAVDVADLVAGHVADVKAAKKPPRRALTVAIALNLPGPFANGAGVSVVANDGPAVAGRRRSLAQVTTVPTPMTAADAAALAAARAGPAPVRNVTPPADVLVDPSLVDGGAVRDAVLGLLRARLGRLPAASPLTAASLAATVVPADPTGAVFVVAVKFRGDVATAAALANAVNDVPPPRERACAGWTDRVGFDFCGALAAATPLVVDGVEVRQ